MRLPTIEGIESTFPAKAECPWCKSNKVFEPHSMAILAGGSCLMDRATDSGGPADEMDGFLHLTWHGAHDGGLGADRDIYAMIEIARDVRGGQFEIYFCSTMCHRAYLNYCVDKLEGKIEEQSGTGDRIR